jgi:DNA modification methylase
MRPNVYYSDPAVTLWHGDSIETMRELPDNSIDSIVTDPPYGLGFMGKAWDALPPGEEWAAECLRVLKPGGHLLAFGGSRTWHRLAVAVEDAGFEIRDSIAWLYGSGFPKSLDVSKAIDKARDDKADVYSVTAQIATLRDAAGMTNRDLDEACGLDSGGASAAHWTAPAAAKQPRIPTVEQWSFLRELLNPDAALESEVWRLNSRKGAPGEAWQEAEVTGVKEGAMSGWDMDGGTKFVDRELKAPNSDAAAQWQGWGTALKPAFEPVVVARKPFPGTVAANVQTWGTGALNIDATRIGLDGEKPPTGSGAAQTGTVAHGDRASLEGGSVTPIAGRWPANVVLDETTAPLLDQQSGVLKSGGYPPEGGQRSQVSTFGKPNSRGEAKFGASEGGASRFFKVAEPDVPFLYAAKAPKRERPVVDGVAHPTVKPLALMRWLVKLVTPPGGVVLDPFEGSGTTLEACLLEGFNHVGIEREADYLPMIMARIDRQAGTLPHAA